MTLNGWPDRIQDVPHIMCHFWGTRDELTIKDGILSKSLIKRISIPPELCEMTLHDLHDSLKGIEKMQYLARAHLLAQN